MELAREERGAVTLTRVRTASCEIEMTDHGAQVLRWRPTGGPDALWVSPSATWERGRPIRGGIPLCFPWFGARDGGPSHGFARIVRWTASEPEVDGDGVRFRHVLEPDADTLSHWPHRFRVEVTVHAGTELRHVVRVENAGGQALSCELALHGYFAVLDARRATVEGLARAPFFDKVDAVQGVRGDEPLGFGSEVDAVLSPPGPRVTLVDPGLGRRIEVDRDGAHQVVVWNPGPTQRLADVPADGWRSFVCVETAAVRERALTLPPGGAAVVTQRVGVR